MPPPPCSLCGLVLLLCSCSASPVAGSTWLGGLAWPVEAHRVSFRPDDRAPVALVTSLSFRGAILRQGAEEEFTTALKAGADALAAGDPSAAVTALRTAVQLRPRHPLALAYLGRALLGVGEVPDALAILRGVTTMAPELFAAHSDLASALLRLGRYQEAYGVLEAAAQLRPLDAGVLYSQAFVLAALRNEKAGRPLGSSGARDPVGTEDWSLLGARLSQQGSTFVSFIRAAEAYAQALQLRPNDVGLAVELARVYRRLSMLQRGLDLLQRLSDAAPTSPELLLERGRILNELHRYEQARQALEHSIRAGVSADADVQYELGIARMNLAEHAEAQQAFDTALRLRPEFLEARLRLGELLLLRQEFELARAVLQGAVERDPDSAEVLDLLGLASLRAGDPSSALRHLESALALDPHRASATLNLALALRDLGRPQESRIVAERHNGLERRQRVEAEQQRKETMAVTLNMQGLFHYRHGELQEAIARFEHAVALSPESDLIHYNLGLAHAATPDHQRAAAALERAIEINPDRLDTYVALATEYRALGREEDARRTEARIQQR